MIPKNKFDRIIQKIEDSCEKCNGQSCSTCRAKIGRTALYAQAEIPIDYWERSWKDFQGDPNFKEKIKEILTKIHDQYDNGKSYAFVGNFGVGKSYAACAILKFAITEGFTAKYVTMSDLIRTLLHDNGEIYQEVTNVDFLVIDEFDIRYVFPTEKSEILFGQNMESILRNRFQNKIPTILCSNTIEIEKVLSGKFSEAFGSLISASMEICYVIGKDFRKMKKDLNE